LNVELVRYVRDCGRAAPSEFETLWKQLKALVDSEQRIADAPFAQ